jgi:hypothetical protein
MILGAVGIKHHFRRCDDNESREKLKRGFAREASAEEALDSGAGKGTDVTHAAVCTGCVKWFGF